MASKIMQKIGAFKRKAVLHTINDAEFKFYPVRMSLLLSGDLKEAIAPIAKAITTLMTCGDQVKAERHTQLAGDNDPDMPPGSVYTKETEVSVPLADWAVATRGNAMQGAVNALFDQKVKLTIGRVLADSLRDDFDKNPDDDDVAEFVDALDIRDLAEFCVGFMKANAEVFGLDADNREKLGNLVRDLLKNLKAGNAPALQVVPDETTEE
jgi:hypothetical protein